MCCGGFAVTGGDLRIGGLSYSSSVGLTCGLLTGISRMLAGIGSGVLLFRIGVLPDAGRMS